MENNADAIQISAILMMLCIGFVGIVFHWLQAAVKKRVTLNLFNYLFIDERGASGTMFASYLASMWGLYSLGAFDLIRMEYVKEAWDAGYVFKPFVHAVVESVTVGYVCDSAFNKPGIPKTDRRARIHEMQEEK